MKKRRRQGATLGLVAVCVLVIIVLGVGCFFLAKIFGGGREVANATDAGALNIAKYAMKANDPLSRVSVALPGANYTDFVMLADPPSSKEINLLTYNRVVAQTLLVAMNAQAEGTPDAATNAKKVVDNLDKLGAELRAKLQDKQLVSFFGQVDNNLKMFGNNALNAQANTYTTAFMKPGESTNVYFTPQQLLTLSLPGNADSKGTTKVPPAGSSGHYIRGYEAINVPGVGAIMGVPVFPQQNPHLVALSDFKKAATPLGSTPPNAFSVAAASQESKTGVMGGAIAAAIVGASKFKAGGAQAANYDFPASFPGGYISIVNAPSANMPADSTAFDQSDNIFNNELYLGPGIDVTGTGGNNGAFSNTDMGATAAWAAYNNSSSSDPSGGGESVNGNFTADSRNKNALLYPPTSTYNGGPHKLSDIYTTSNPSIAGTNNPPDMAILLAIKGKGINCLDQMNTGPDFFLVDNTACTKFLQSFELTFGHGKPTGGANNSGLYSNVDYAKGQVIAAFQSGKKKETVTGSQNQGLPDSGLGVFANGVNSPYPQPHYNPGGSIQKTGTIMELLTQVTSGTQVKASCTKDKIIAALTQRCYEINPGATTQEIDKLWNTPLPIGQTVYIYLGNDAKLHTQSLAPQTLIVSAGLPTKADGAPLDSNFNCESQYSLDNNMIDVPKSNGGISDNNLHDRPYTETGGAMFGHDKATLVLSSGYQNMLGQLSFSNSTEGVENFSRPN